MNTHISNSNTSMNKGCKGIENDGGRECTTLNNQGRSLKGGDI